VLLQISVPGQAGSPAQSVSAQSIAPSPSSSVVLLQISVGARRHRRVMARRSRVERRPCTVAVASLFARRAAQLHDEAVDDGDGDFENAVDLMLISVGGEFIFFSRSVISTSVPVVPGSAVKV
jgi:hypothetical protein